MWFPQHYLDESNALGLPRDVAEASIAQIDAVRSLSDERPSILSLGHLADRTGVDYHHLRAIVGRRIDPYRSFSIRKRSGGNRTISVPEPGLMRVQKLLASRVLCTADTHASSFGFKKNSSIVHCAKRHVGAKWLIKFDIADFFHNTSEKSVYWVYRRLGYQPLASFELARISTRVFKQGATRYRKSQWTVSSDYEAIDGYSDPRIGHLPQGAPTSPMLANLCCKQLDQKLADLAQNLNIRFTRYSDDITFSSWRREEKIWKWNFLVENVYKILNGCRYTPNKEKTVISPPGSRKIVLGLLVDGDKPRLTTDFRDNLRMHLYFANHPEVGVIRHAIDVRGFDSVWGFKNHLRGLIDFSNMVDPEFAANAMIKFNTIDWPI